MAKALHRAGKAKFTWTPLPWSDGECGQRQRNVHLAYLETLVLNSIVEDSTNAVKPMDVFGNKPLEQMDEVKPMRNDTAASLDSALDDNAETSEFVRRFRR